MKILVTCPPMLGMMGEFLSQFRKKQIDVHCPQVVQTLSEEELIQLVPQFDGWVIGDDPATRRVLAAGKSGALKAAVKWGIGVDNIDLTAAHELGVAVANTPNMFGSEVADVAMAYVVGLARELFVIDRDVRNGRWPKPSGISLSGKTAGVIGFGDIGRNIATRLLAAEMKVIAYDPAFKPTSKTSGVHAHQWPERIEECDFLILACPLTNETLHILNSDRLESARQGVCIVNVSRGAVIDESALIAALRTGKVRSAALEVFENEPLPMSSPLRQFDRCIFGSHNASNTLEAVRKTSERAMSILFELLDV